MPSKPRMFEPIRPMKPRRQTNQQDIHRGKTAARGYGKDWQRLRSWVLAGEPLCRHCQRDGRLTPAEELHHDQPVKDRPDLRLDPANLVPLCRSCHRTEELRRSKGDA